MSTHVCPWWLGYFLASPVRRLVYNPAKILAPYIREGMTVFEPGPGMGFLTLEAARRVGESGRVVAIDLQPRMLSALQRRAPPRSTPRVHLGEMGRDCRPAPSPPAPISCLGPRPREPSAARRIQSALELDTEAVSPRPTAPLERRRTQST